MRSVVRVYPGPPFLRVDLDRVMTSRLLCADVGSLAIGALAQLGERLLCKQDVVGSIPSGSTKSGSDFAWLGPTGRAPDGAVAKQADACAGA